MSPHTAPAAKARASTARQPKVPSLIHNHANGHVYARVYWQGKSYPLGRRDAPDFERRRRELVAHLLVHGVPPSNHYEENQLPSYTVAELVAHYLDHCEVYYRLPDGTKTRTIGYVRTAVKPLLELFGAIQARAFDEAMLRNYREKVVDLGNSRNKCNAKVQIVRRMFTRAGGEGRLEPAVGLALSVLKPLQRGRSKARDLPPRQPVAWEHVEPILAHRPRPVAGIIKVL